MRKTFAHYQKSLIGIPLIQLGVKRFMYVSGLLAGPAFLLYTIRNSGSRTPFYDNRDFRLKEQ